MSNHILSVSYDEPLLRTREMLLNRQGYTVTSIVGFTEAVAQCKAAKFDLFILGHSIPLCDKRELIRLFRSTSTAPILALARHGEATPDGADAHVYPENIADLLKTVDKLLTSPRSRQSEEGTRGFESKQQQLDSKAEGSAGA